MAPHCAIAPLLLRSPAPGKPPLLTGHVIVVAADAYGKMTEQITVSVDSDIATIYRSASVEDRRKLDLLINLRLRDVAESGISLTEIMSDVSRNAQRRGLTREILQSILDGD